MTGLFDGVLRTVLDTFGPETGGVSATVRLAGEAPATVTVVFDAAYQLLELGAVGLEATSTAPAALVRDADLPRVPRQGDEVELVDGRRFVVAEVQPDGQGGSLCRLHAL